MIILHNAVLILQIHIIVFSYFINVYHLLIIEKIVRKYNLNTTLSHILMQHVNSLTIVINI